VIKNNKILGIIPARGGSKGLPGKNILNLCSKPLIAWTIEEAKKSTIIDKLIVSTDDQKVAEISKEYGCEVPFKRPKRLSQDNSITDDVVIHALETINETFEIIIILQPTSPLRTYKDIDNSLKFLIENKCQSVISMCLSDKPYEWYHSVDKKGFIKKIFNSSITNRQLSNKSYLPNGAIYASFIDNYKINKTFYHENSMGYIMPKNRSIDIDDILDFKIAEFLLNDQKFI
jgi:CMP-N,N'-diacetyllegionaminic acid synthase